MALADIIEQTVTGLGYDLVEVERFGAGLLRVTIDWPWCAPAAGAPAQERFIGVDDCEKVTRQLQFALEVEAIEYKRLEVSSPGIDRLLRQQQDFVRFTGQVIDIVLKAPLGTKAGGTISANRKKFRGQLEPAAPVSDLAQQPESFQWQIVWRDEIKTKPGAKLSKKRQLPPLQALLFTLDELSTARLAPVVDFKGRRVAGASEELESD